MQWHLQMHYHHLPPIGRFVYPCKSKSSPISDGDSNSVANSTRIKIRFKYPNFLSDKPSYQKNYFSNAKRFFIPRISDHKIS